MNSDAKLPSDFDRLLEFLRSKTFLFVWILFVIGLGFLLFPPNFQFLDKGPEMANLIPSPEDFQTLIVKEKRPVMVIFFDSNSSKNRVKGYEKIINADYSTVLNFKVNLDDDIISKAEENKYVPQPLICCTAICNDSLRSSSNPGEKDFRLLMEWLQKCKPKQQDQ